MKKNSQPTSKCNFWCKRKMPLECSLCNDPTFRTRIGQNFSSQSTECYSYLSQTLSSAIISIFFFFFQVSIHLQQWFFLSQVISWIFLHRLIGRDVWEMEKKKIQHDGNTRVWRGELKCNFHPQWHMQNPSFLLFQVGGYKVFLWGWEKYVILQLLRV